MVVNYDTLELAQILQTNSRIRYQLTNLNRALSEPIQQTLIQQLDINQIDLYQNLKSQIESFRPRFDHSTSVKLSDQEKHHLIALNSILYLEFDGLKLDVEFLPNELIKKVSKESQTIKSRSWFQILKAFYKHRKRVSSEWRTCSVLFHFLLLSLYLYSWFLKRLI